MCLYIYMFLRLKNNQNRSRAHIPAHAHSHSGQKMMKYFPADLFRIRPRDCKQVNSCTLTSSCSPGLGRGLEPTLKSLKNPAEPSSLAGRDFSISSPAAGCWWKSRRWSSSNLPAAGSASRGFPGWTGDNPAALKFKYPASAEPSFPPCPVNQRWQQRPFYLENISISARRGETKTLLNTGWCVTLHGTLNVIKCLNFFPCLFSLDDCLSLSLTASAGPNWQLFKAVWQKAALIKSLPDCNCVKK